MRSLKFAIALMLVVPAAALAAPPNPYVHYSSPCSMGYSYQAVTVDKFAFRGWALFDVYQMEFNCKQNYVGRRWCQFVKGHDSRGGVSRPYVWGCQVRRPDTLNVAIKQR